SIQKPWIAAVESFAIGGHCQVLLVMDYVLAERSAFLTLPARKEGIIPGAANMRLPRFTGDRIARQAIQYERRLDCDSPEGRLICDEIVPTGGMDAAIERVVSGLTNSGVVSAASNRRAFRITQEPLDTFRSYFAVYAREQAYCHFSPALIVNLERYWNAQDRKPCSPAIHAVHAPGSPLRRRFPRLRLFFVGEALHGPARIEQCRIGTDRDRRQRAAAIDHGLLDLEHADVLGLYHHALLLEFL